MTDTVELAITGMTCQHCVAAVRKALQAVPGVEQVVSVDLESGSAAVNGKAPAEQLIAAVKEAGYEAAVR